MFLKGICTYVHLQFLALAESIMSSPPPSDAIFLFLQTPQKTGRFEVDSWADYALYEVSYAFSTTTIIDKIIHCKSTQDVAHEFTIWSWWDQSYPRVAGALGSIPHLDLGSLVYLNIWVIPSDWHYPILSYQNNWPSGGLNLQHPCGTHLTYASNHSAIVPLQLHHILAIDLTHGLTLIFKSHL